MSDQNHQSTIKRPEIEFEVDISASKGYFRLNGEEIKVRGFDLYCRAGEITTIKLYVHPERVKGRAEAEVTFVNEYVQPPLWEDA